MKVGATCHPTREVRARFRETTVRVYQAFSSEIAEPALSAQRFKLPFKRDRMTWIKPSFTWMMYRSGFGTKVGQTRVLGIDILRDGLEWALAHSCLTHFDATLYTSADEWRESLRSFSVRVQWDPERTVQLEPLPWRTIQIGLRGEAVDAYLDEWVVGIEDLTTLAGEMEAAVREHQLERARALLPREVPYPLPTGIGLRIGASVTKCDGRDDISWRPGLLCPQEK